MLSFLQTFWFSRTRKVTFMFRILHCLPFKPRRVHNMYWKISITQPSKNWKNSKANIISRQFLQFWKNYWGISIGTNFTYRLHSGVGHVYLSMTSWWELLPIAAVAYICRIKQSSLQGVFGVSLNTKLRKIILK